MADIGDRRIRVAQSMGGSGTVVSLYKLVAVDSGSNSEDWRFRDSWATHIEPRPPDELAEAMVDHIRRVHALLDASELLCDDWVSAGDGETYLDYDWAGVPRCGRCVPCQLDEMTRWLRAWHVD